MEAQPRQKLAYDEFVTLPDDRRDAVFQRLNAEDKAAIMRTRFERWLEEHRKDLSARQISTVGEAIDLVTPQIFEGPPDEQMKRRQNDVSERLACSLGSELAYSFAKGKPASTASEVTWTHVLRSWTEWVVECVLK